MHIQSGGLNRRVFIADVNDLNSAENPPIAMNELEVSTFLTDQVVYMCEVCRVPATTVKNPQLCEWAVLRMLGYRLRLITQI